jgi:hypothetical protein
MNLIDLEAFVSVVDHGSVVAAAAGLHLTQSAVTRRIQNLEDALGTPLLDRQTRPLQPTRAGQETYEFAKPVLSSVNDLKTGIMQGGEPSGDFRFGMSRALGDLAIGAPIRCLRADFPKVQIQAFVQWRGAFGAPRESSPGLRRGNSSRGKHATSIASGRMPWTGVILRRGGERKTVFATGHIARAVFACMGSESSWVQHSATARRGIPSARASICLCGGSGRI